MFASKVTQIHVLLGHCNVRSMPQTRWHQRQLNKQIRQRSLIVRAPTIQLNASNDQPFAEECQVQSSIEAVLQEAGSLRQDVAKIQPLIDSLAQAGVDAGLNEVNPAFNVGNFVQRLTTDLRAVSVDSVTTLGRLAFNTWKPLDLRVQIDRPNFIYKGVFEDISNAYVVSAEFALLDYDLRGCSLALGSYAQSLDNPGMLDITFLGSRLVPAKEVLSNPAKLKQWLDLFLPDNPLMNGQTGEAQFTFPKQPHGTLKYLVMSERWQVSQGNFGTVVIAERVPGDQTTPTFIQ